MTTFSTGGSAVTFTTAGSAVSFAVTPASNAFTTSAVLTPGAHASTHGAGGADPITTLGAVAHSGQQTFAAGSAAGPSIAFTGDTNTGIYSPGADQVGIATAGTARVVVGATGNVGIGTTSPSGALHVQGSGAPTVFIGTTVGNTNDAELVWQKARGGTGAASVITTGDDLGTIRFQGHDGTSYVNAVTIQADSEGTIGTGIVPGSLSIFTADSAGSLTQRIKVDPAGLITGTGTSLGAWTSYTPTWGGNVTNPVIGDGTLTGAYMRLGKLVIGRVRIVMGSTTTYGSGTWYVSLPIDAASANSYPLNTGIVNDASVGTNRTIQANFASVTNLFLYYGDTFTDINATAPWTWATSDVLNLTFAYEIA